MMKRWSEKRGEIEVCGEEEERIPTAGLSLADEETSFPRPSVSTRPHSLPDTPTAFTPSSYPPPRNPGARPGSVVKPKAYFNLEPEYIPVSRLSVEMEEEELRVEDLTESQMRELKEQSQKRVKRIVAAVGITLTIISIVLVALSLSLGPKIDDLVSQSPDSRGNPQARANEFLGPRPVSTHLPPNNPAQ